MAELLDAGPDRPVRWRPAAVVGLLVLVVLGAVRLDEVQRSRETDALLDRVAAGQAATAYADRRLLATVTYGTPLLFSASTTPQVRASLQRLVQDAAADQVGRVSRLRAETRRTRVLPWHDPQRAARGAYADYLRDFTAYLEAIEADADALYVSHRELAAALERSRAALLRAAPRDRVRVVLPQPAE